jgi:hypothetical protein
MRFLAALVLLLSTACTTVTSSTARIREAGTDRRIQRTDVDVATLPSTYALLRETAVLSAVAYPDSTLQPPSPWTRVPDIPQPARKPRYKQIGGLAYEVFADETTTPKRAILVFRGTDAKIDWYSNLRWLTFWIPRVEDQYEQTQKVVPEIVAALKSRYGSDVQIVATGHSLGGGLAQLAGYVACNDIKTVYAFDPSPVTKHKARKTCTNGLAADNVYRIYEDNEVLAYARLGLRFTIGLTPENPRITEVKVRLLEGKFTGHSMQQLAAQIQALR